MIKKKTVLKLSVVIPMRNASSTILKTLESIRKQNYPIQEIIIVDNISDDNSVILVNEYSNKYKNMHIVLLRNKENIMIARSQDRAVHKAKSPYIIFTHADCRFPTANEISKLVSPIEKDPSILATYGGSASPFSVWNHYSFWEKCLWSQDVGKIKSPGLLGKVDCIQKKAFLEIGGHDTKGFDNYGCEDADLHLRLAQKGRIVRTSAVTQHLHYVYSNFSLSNLFWKTKFIGEGYGRFLRVNGLQYGISPIVYMFYKPILALGTLIPVCNFIFLILLFIYPFYYYQKIFTTPSTLKDWRIFLLPFIGMVLVYYQTFWMVVTYTKSIPK